MLYKRGGEGTRKADAKAEEPHDVHVDGRGLRLEHVVSWQGELCSV